MRSETVTDDVLCLAIIEDYARNALMWEPDDDGFGWIVDFLNTPDAE